MSDQGGTIPSLQLLCLALLKRANFQGTQFLPKPMQVVLAAQPEIQEEEKEEEEYICLIGRKRTRTMVVNGGVRKRVRESWVTSVAHSTCKHIWDNYFVTTSGWHAQERDPVQWNILKTTDDECFGFVDDK